MRKLSEREYQLFFTLWLSKLLNHNSQKGFEKAKQNV